MILYKILSPVLLFLFVLFSHTIFAQQKDKTNTAGGLFLSGRTGISFLVTEIYRDLSGTATEFSNQPGPSAGLEVSGFITPSLEAGAEFSYNFLKGLAEVPNFSATGFHHSMLNSPNGPVEYTNRLYGPGLFARYHFGHNLLHMRTMNFYIKAGAGIFFNESELFYSNHRENGIIFGKGNRDEKTTKLSNGVFTLGAGLNYSLSERISLKTTASLNMVGYDFLDVVHNYDAAGNRQEVLGLFTDITAGITIKLKQQKRTSSPGRSGSASPHLPFSR